MKTASLTNNIQYEENRPTIQVLIDTEAGKELRIALKKNSFWKGIQPYFRLLSKFLKSVSILA